MQEKLPADTVVSVQVDFTNKTDPNLLFSPTGAYTYVRLELRQFVFVLLALKEIEQICCKTGAKDER